VSLTRHKPFIEIVFLLGLLLLVQAGGAFAAARMDGWSLPKFGPSERFNVDARSGVALRGFDPVAYFDIGNARAGLAAHEAVWGGVAWRFLSAANRAAFLSSPETYQPRFGGYDAEAASRGFVVDADPTIFTLANGRLYVFRSTGNKERFLSDAETAERAERAWARLGKTLTN
jgi:hypothetical protein